MKKMIYSLAVVLMLAMCGCNLEEQDGYNSSITNSDHVVTDNTTESGSTALTTTTIQTPASTSIGIDDVIPEAIQTPRIDGDRLTFRIVNVYADGQYYTVDISGIKYTGAEGTPDIDTTYINGELYGDFRLELMQKGEILDSLKINVPRDDRFLILESVTEGLSYGCELISNKRDFGSDEYPDLIQLDYHILNEVEVPQYARYFAIFDGKLTEVPVYENGKEVAPYGTHVETKDAGLMVQHIVAEEYNGSYTVIKYEYTFDVEKRSLVRKQVRFYGWEE